MEESEDMRLWDEKWEKTVPVTWRRLPGGGLCRQAGEGRAGRGAVPTDDEHPGDVSWAGRQGPGRQKDALTLHRLLAVGAY